MDLKIVYDQVEDFSDDNRAYCEKLLLDKIQKFCLKIVKNLRFQGENVEHEKFSYLVSYSLPR